MALRHLLPLNFFVLLICRCVAAEDYGQLLNSSSNRFLSDESVQKLLKSDEITCRVALENVSTLCHTAKLRDRVKLASLITTCIENSLNINGNPKTSCWDDMSGLQKAPQAHIEMLLSFILPSLRTLCENTMVSSVASYANIYFSNEETLSNSSSNVRQTSRILKDCEPIEELSSLKEIFDDFAVLIEAMIPFIKESSNASSSHWKAFKMFTTKMRRKFRFFQSRIESQIGEVEGMMEDIKKSYRNHRKSLWEIKPYLNSFGNMIDIEIRLQKLQTEMERSHRASVLTSYEWLARRGLEPQKCFLHLKKTSETAQHRCDGNRKVGRRRMSQIRQTCKKGDQLWMLLLTTRRFLSVKLRQLVGFDAYNATGKEHSNAVLLNQLRKGMKSELKCVYTHGRGVLMLLVLVLLAFLYVLRRMLAMREELKAQADEIALLFAKEFKVEQGARQKNGSAARLCDISKRLAELMTMCDYFEVVLRSCDGVCREVEGAMNAGVAYS